MKLKLLILVILFGACTNNEPKIESTKVDSLKVTPETNQVPIISKTEPIRPVSETYSNKRFKDVWVEKVGENKYRIRGKGQIFEANFNWIVEDGHNELKKGFHTTDAGAPAWGKFDFIIDVKKIRENSTLILILFESSAKDGSRQYELPIALK